MDIYINGQKADITLDKEKTLGDVLTGLEAALSGDGAVIAEISLDGSKISDYTGVFDREIEGLKRLDLTAEQPEQELEALRPSLMSLAERMEELPLDFQTGKEAHASETMVIFSRTVQSLVRLLALLHNKEELDGWKDLIAELSDAYKNEDMISAGDLAEYEIAPRLRAL
jgi:hypothetical protein